MDAILAGGSRLGRYEVGALVASEETGDLYRAWDTRLNRAVALKIVAGAVAEGDAHRVAQFFEEAQTTALIAHPNIASVFAVGADRGRPFVVSKLLHGESLRTLLREQRLPVPVAVTYALAIAHGLIAAHELGVVHRRLTPDHVFVTVDGCVKIADFGLPNGPAAMLSAAAYVSPEQAGGATGDERSDIFSLGVMLYEMLAGKRPFSRAAAGGVRGEIVARVPAPLPPEVEISPELQHVIGHCLELDPAARFQSARDVAFVLEFTRRAPQPAPQPASVRGRLASVLRRL